MRQKEQLAVVRNIGKALYAGVALAVTATLTSVAVACEDANATTTISFANQIQPLLNERCVVCHITGAENGELNMEPGLALGNLVNVPSTESRLNLITPGNPQASYLIHKLRGTHIEVGGRGDQMPFGAEPLEDDQLALITKWIEDCAPAN